MTNAQRWQAASQNAGSERHTSACAWNICSSRCSRRWSGASRSSACLKALPAEHRTPLRRTERNRGQFSASRAGGLSLNLGIAVILARHWRRAEHGNPFGLAVFTAFGLVFELLVVKEKLFSGCEDEIRPTIHTLQHLVLKLHFEDGSLRPFSRLPTAGEQSAVMQAENWVCTSPPQVFPLGSARHTPGRRVDTTITSMPEDDECDRPYCSSTWWGPDWAEPPREGAALPALILFFACLFARSFTSERSLYTFFFAGLQVEGVALDLLDNVFLLHLALKAAQSVLEGFSLLKAYFSQTDTPPDSSGRTA